VQSFNYGSTDGENIDQMDYIKIGEKQGESIPTVYIKYNNNTTTPTLIIIESNNNNNEVGRRGDNKIIIERTIK
jgi:hypothetical protein